MLNPIQNDLLAMRRSAQQLLTDALDEISAPDPALAEMDPDTRELTVAINYAAQSVMVMLLKSTELMERIVAIKAKALGKA